MIFFRIQALREELLRGSYDIVLLQVLSVHCFIFYYDFEYEECVRKVHMFCLVVVNMNCLRSLEQMIFLGLIKTFVVSVLTVPRIEDVECGQSARWWLVTWHITLQSLSSSPALVHYFIKFC